MGVWGSPVRVQPAQPPVRSCKHETYTHAAGVDPSGGTTRPPSLAIGGANENVLRTCGKTAARAARFGLGRLRADPARAAQCRAHSAGAPSDARAARALPRLPALADLHGLPFSPRGGAGGAPVAGAC